MSSEYKVNWFNDFVGVAYRYYDLRMNVVPLFPDYKKAAEFWRETIHWWVDPSIRIRFVEIENDYWFIMGSESKRVKNNASLFKILPKSDYYERFKKGHEGEAYLRLGVYTKKSKKDVKDDAVCSCSHVKEDHEEGDDDSCLYEDCDCKKFESFQVNLLRKKKTVTDIEFLTEDEIKDDALAWNCFSSNKYNQEKESSDE